MEIYIYFSNLDKTLKSLHKNSDKCNNNRHIMVIKKQCNPMIFI